MPATGVKSFQTKNVEAVNRGRQVTRSRHLEIVAFYGLLATILLFAIPYGTVEVWHKSLLVLIIAILGGFRVTDCILRGSFRIGEAITLLPLVGILGLATAQIVRWPGYASSISLDPYETKVFILIFGGLIVVGEILYFYTNSMGRLKWLVCLVIVVGVVSAIFGLLRRLFLDHQFELLSGYLQPEQGFAQFINRNHFAMLIEMSLGLLLGMLIKGEFSEKVRFVGWIFSGITMYSIIASSSRGGLISLAALSVFAMFVHIITRNNSSLRQRERRGRIDASTRMTLQKVSVALGLCGLLLGLIVVTIAFVGGDAVVTRIEKLGGEVETIDNTRVNRKLIWNSTLDLIKDKPILGNGFGGYAAAIPAFDKSGGKFVLKQAHNDYLEILANGGIVGFGFFAAFGVIASLRILKNLKSKDSFRRSCCFGAAIGIFGVLIHSFVDFGLHIMINALVFVVLIVIGTANIGEPSET